MNAFQPHMQMIVDHTAVFATNLVVRGPRVVTDYKHVYFYRNWGVWVGDLAFERRFRHCREHAESVFVAQHNVDVFAVLIARRLFLYILLTAWWT